MADFCDVQGSSVRSRCGICSAARRAIAERRWSIIKSTCELRLRYSPQAREALPGVIPALLPGRFLEISGVRRWNKQTPPIQVLAQGNADSGVPGRQ